MMRCLGIGVTLLSLAPVACSASNESTSGDCVGAVAAAATDGREDPRLWVEQAKLLATGGAEYDSFGYAVSMDGNTAIVGAWGDDDGGSDSGSAQVFVRSVGVWSFEQALAPADAAAGDRFGESVSVSGDSALVGAPEDDASGSDSGSAYVFARSAGSWSEQQELLPSDGASNDEFGRAVALLDGTALVGAPQDNASGLDSGSAYVFVRSAGAWSEQQKLVADDGSGDDRFGRSVAIAGDSLLIGAYDDNASGVDSGSAYVFVRSASSWNQQQKLVPADGAAQDRFGVSVSLSGDTAAIGAYRDDDAGSNSGSAYIFLRSAGSWGQQAKLLAADSAQDDYFGIAVSTSRDMALVGAPQHDVNGSESGAVYVFARSAQAWSEQSKLIPSDNELGDRLGFALSLSGATALIGAYGDDDDGSYSGSAYALAVHAQPCSNDTECPSGYCVDGVCCDDGCGGDDPDDCLACVAALIGPSGEDGYCGPIPDGADCDDGSFCNGPETCSGGACTDAAGDPCAPSVGDGDANCSEACDEQADTCSAPDPDGTLCADGSCLDGLCLGSAGTGCIDDADCITLQCVDGFCCLAASCGAYRCGPTGNCRDSCSSTAECADGYQCTADGRCKPPAGTAEQPSSCGCRVVRGGRGAPAWLLLVLLALGAKARWATARPIRRFW